MQRCARVCPCPSLPSLQPRLGGSISSRCPAGQADPRLGSFPSQRAATTIWAQFCFLEMSFLPKSGSPALLLQPPLLPELTGVFCENRFGFSLMSSPLPEKKQKAQLNGHQPVLSRYKVPGCHVRSSDQEWARGTARTVTLELCPAQTPRPGLVG